MKMVNKINSNKVEKKIKEATILLEQLGFPRQQINERSALTLLSLLDLKPDDSCSTPVIP